MTSLERALPRWTRVLGRDVTGLLATLAAIVGLAANAAAFRTPLAPWSAEPGQTVPLAARLFLLLLAVAGPRRLSWLASAGIGALFLASLAARGLAIPAVLVSVAALRMAPSRGGPVVPSWIVPAAVAIAAVAFVPIPPRVLTTAPADPASAVDYWRARKNMRRAHAAAVAWAKTEQPPREGYLALAKIDLELGRPDVARKVLQKVLDRTDSDEVRAQARTLEASLHDEPPR